MIEIPLPATIGGVVAGVLAISYASARAAEQQDDSETERAEAWNWPERTDEREQA